MKKVSIQEAKKQIDALTKQINHYNHLYYQEDNSEISDFEFDILLNQLIQLETDFPELKKLTVPANVLEAQSPKILRRQAILLKCSHLATPILRKNWLHLTRGYSRDWSIEIIIIFANLNLMGWPLVWFMKRANWLGQ